MSDMNKVNNLLAAALRGAADVARSRLDREITVVPCEAPASTAILRFDLSFSRGGRLSWFVSNEDATGFSDMLIGGEGDRGAVLTEMHLDALTVAFSDMLTRAVDSILGALDESLEAGDLDLGMEGSMPAVEPGGVSETSALDITGFGAFPIVQHVDAELATYLQAHALAGAIAAADPVPAAAALDIEAIAAAALGEDQPAPAGPTGAAQQPVVDGVPATGGNVVQLPGAAAASANLASVNAPAQPARPATGGGDLELLMNVPLPLTVELGRTQRTIRELVDFTVGSIIELGKLAGDPLDIMVNDRVIARGEVVVIDEEFGIRVTEIVSPEDRIQGLA